MGFIFVTNFFSCPKHSDLSFLQTIFRKIKSKNCSNYKSSTEGQLLVLEAADVRAFTFPSVFLVATENR